MTGVLLPWPTKKTQRLQPPTATYVSTSWMQLIGQTLSLGLSFVPVYRFQNGPRAEKHCRSLGNFLLYYENSLLFLKRFEERNKAHSCRLDFRSTMVSLKVCTWVSRGSESRWGPLIWIRPQFYANMQRPLPSKHTRLLAECIARLLR